MDNPRSARFNFSRHPNRRYRDKVSPGSTFQFFLCLLFFVTQGYGQSHEKLVCRVKVPKASEGMVVINLFRQEDDLPRKPFMTARASIANEIASIEFNDLPFGDYAAIAYHDQNSNGILDHKMGFPNEPIGFSNHWKLTLFSGMPTFRKLKFTLNSEHHFILIEID